MQRERKETTIYICKEKKSACESETHKTREKSVVYKCNDYNDNDDDYEEPDNNMEYYESSSDNDDIDDASGVKDNDDGYQQTKHRKRNVKCKKLNKKSK